MNRYEELDNYVYEKLYDAIIKSITSSQKVKEILKDIQAEGKIHSMAVMNVILSLEELSDLIQPSSTLNDYESKDYKSKELKESCKEDFDEVQWSKRLESSFKPG